jgi:hypothetical protein
MKTLLTILIAITLFNCSEQFASPTIEGGDPSDPLHLYSGTYTVDNSNPVILVTISGSVIHYNDVYIRIVQSDDRGGGCIYAATANYTSQLSLCSEGPSKLEIYIDDSEAENMMVMHLTRYVD